MGVGRSPATTTTSRPSIYSVDPFDDRPEELSELARSAFTLSIQYYGEYNVACLLSKKLELRDEVLAEITKRVDVDYGMGKEIDGIDKVSRFLSFFYQIFIYTQRYEFV